MVMQGNTITRNRRGELSGKVQLWQLKAGADACPAMPAAVADHVQQLGWPSGEDNTPRSLLLRWHSREASVPSNLSAKGQGTSSRLSSAAVADWAPPVPTVHARAAQLAAHP